MSRWSRWELRGVLLAGLLLAGMGGADAATSLGCAAGIRVDVSGSRDAVIEQKLARAACVAAGGAAVLHDAAGLPNPLPISVVEMFRGSRVNAAFLRAGWFDSTPDRFVVTADLAARFGDDALAFVLAHETAHQVHGDNSALRWFAVLRALGAYLIVCGAVLLLVRAPGLRHRGIGFKAVRLAAGLGLAGAFYLLATVAIAGFSTHIEYSADAAGLRFLVANGFSPARAERAFQSFLDAGPEEAAGSWLDVNRHPSHAERKRAVEELVLAL